MPWPSPCNALGLSPLVETARREAPTRRGDKVRFRVADVFLPGPEQVFVAPTAETQLEGTIAGFSDSGADAEVFAVVETVCEQTLVVPVSRLSEVPGGESKSR